jgi:hypothetical protein
VKGIDDEAITAPWTAGQLDQPESFFDVAVGLGEREDADPRDIKLTHLARHDGRLLRQRAGRHRSISSRLHRCSS